MGCYKTSSSYAYDADGRITQMRQTLAPEAGANTTTLVHYVSYTYNPAGNLASITYPSGRVVRIGYANGWPDSVSVAPSAAASATPLITGLQFTASGDPKSWNWISGTSSRPHVRVFDQWGRVIRQPIGDLLRDIDYDFAGRISGYRHYVASNGAVAIGYNQGFAYDAADRVTTVYLGGSGYPTWAYTYDANGNRTSVARYSASPSPHTIASTSNRLLRTTSPSASFSYDASGNATGDGTGNALLYDLRGRLVQVNTASGNTARYSHDSAGWRVRKSTTVAGVNQTTVFVYDLMGQLLGEYDASGAAIREYIWLGNMPIALMQPAAQNPTTSPPAVYAIHTDHLNTPRAVVDVASNTLRWRWMAEPFGNTPAETTPTPGQSPMSFSLRMPGQYWDAELGLFYNVQRDYSPLLGRYVQSDPIGLAGGINTYGYVGGNPVSKVDPTGEFGVGGALGGAGFNLATQFLTNMYLTDNDWRRALKCVDFGDVLISGGLGLVGPSFLANVLGGKAGPAGLTAAQNKQIYFTKSLPAGFFLKNGSPALRVGDDCECQGLKLGNLLSAFAH